MAHEVFVGGGDGVRGRGIHGREFKGHSRLVKFVLFLMLDSGNGDITVG
jgi:hypothetical protein